MFVLIQRTDQEVIDFIGAAHFVMVSLLQSLKYRYLFFYGPAAPPGLLSTIHLLCGQDE